MSRNRSGAKPKVTQEVCDNIKNLRFGANLPVQEICVITGLSGNSVYMILKAQCNLNRLRKAQHQHYLKNHRSARRVRAVRAVNVTAVLPPPAVAVSINERIRSISLGELLRIKYFDAGR